MEEKPCAEIFDHSYEFTEAEKRTAKLRRKQRKISDVVRDQIKETVDDNVKALAPESIVDTYDEKGVWIVSLTLLFISTIVFVVSFISQYQTSKNTTFISLDYNAETCEKVPRTLSLTNVGMSTQGYWEGAVGANVNGNEKETWHSNESYWLISFIEVRIDDADFPRLTSYLVSLINKYKESAELWTLVDLYAFYLSFSHTFPCSDAVASCTGLIRVRSDASPSVMFKGVYSFQATLFSRNFTDSGRCLNLKPEVNFNAGKVNLRYPHGYHTEETGDAYTFWSCDSILSKKSFFANEINITHSYAQPNSNIFVSSALSNVVDFQFDITSVFIAAAVNGNLIDFLNIGLYPVEASPRYMVPEGLPLYMSSNFPDMDPILCKMDNGKPSVCFVTVSMTDGVLVYTLPFISTLGFLEGTSSPYECTCPSHDLTPMQRGVCLAGYFRISLLGHSWNSTTADYSSADPAIKIKDSFKSLTEKAHSTPYKNLTSMAFNISVGTSSAQEREEKFSSLCNDIESGTCFLLSTLGFISNKGVTSSFATLNASCIPEDTYSNPFISAKAEANLENTRPSSLSESYYRCHNSERTALTGAVGQAYGVAQSVMATMAITLIPILLILMKRWKILVKPPSHDTYTNAHRQDVLNKLAEVLLRIKRKDTKGLPQQAFGGLKLLHEELTMMLRHKEGPKGTSLAFLDEKPVTQAMHANPLHDKM